MQRGHSATMLSTSHHPVPPRTLDHEARRSLFHYFVFSQTATDRQEKDYAKDGSGLGRDKQGEASATTATSVVVTAAAPVADSKVPPFEKTGLRKGASEHWTTAAACVVCFGEYAPGERLCRLPCRHTYHEQCIDQWLDKANHPCCPMCKADLLALHRLGRAAGGDALAAITSNTANTDNNSTDSNTDNSRGSTASNSSGGSRSSSNNNEMPQPAADLQ